MSPVERHVHGPRRQRQRQLHRDQVGSTKIQGFADLFNLLNAGTVLRVNETYDGNPPTNAWRNPLTIMDGRYIRLGMQMSV